MIQVSIDCGETYNTVFLIDQTNHISTVNMTNIKVELDPFAGEIIKIRFLGIWGGGDYWLDIDNVNIIGCPESLGLGASATPESIAGASDGIADVLVANGQAPYTYDWGTGTANTSPITGLSGGVYDITVTDLNGCEEIISLNIVTCPESLDLTPEINKENPAGANNGSIFLNPSSGTSPYTYLWNNGNTNSGLQGLSEGDYEVVITDVNGCQETLMVALGSGVATNEIPSLAKLSLIPNPTNAVSTLQLEFKEAVQLRVQLRDIVGKVFFDRQESAIQSVQYDLGLSELASGMYFIQITIDGQLHVEKLIKSK